MQPLYTQIKQKRFGLPYEALSSAYERMDKIDMYVRDKIESTENILEEMPYNTQNEELVLNARNHAKEAIGKFTQEGNFHEKAFEVNKLVKSLDKNYGLSEISNEYKLTQNKQKEITKAALTEELKNEYLQKLNRNIGVNYDDKTKSFKSKYKDFNVVSQQDWNKKSLEFISKMKESNEPIVLDEEGNTYRFDSLGKGTKTLFNGIVEKVTEQEIQEKITTYLLNSSEFKNEINEHANLALENRLYNPKTNEIKELDFDNFKKLMSDSYFEKVLNQENALIENENENSETKKELLTINDIYDYFKKEQEKNPNALKNVYISEYGKEKINEISAPIEELYAHTKYSGSFNIPKSITNGKGNKNGEESKKNNLSNTYISDYDVSNFTNVDRYKQYGKDYITFTEEIKTYRNANINSSDIQTVKESEQQLEYAKERKKEAEKELRRTLTEAKIDGVHTAEELLNDNLEKFKYLVGISDSKDIAELTTKNNIDSEKLIPLLATYLNGDKIETKEFFKFVTFNSRDYIRALTGMNPDLGEQYNEAEKAITYLEKNPSASYREYEKNANLSESVKKRFNELISEESKTQAGYYKTAVTNVFKRIEEGINNGNVITSTRNYALNSLLTNTKEGRENDITNFTLRLNNEIIDSSNLSRTGLLTLDGTSVEQYVKGKKKLDNNIAKGNAIPRWKEAKSKPTLKTSNGKFIINTSVPFYTKDKITGNLNFEYLLENDNQQVYIHDVLIPEFKRLNDIKNPSTDQTRTREAILESLFDTSESGRVFKNLDFKSNNTKMYDMPLTTMNGNEYNIKIKPENSQFGENSKRTFYIINSQNKYLVQSPDGEIGYLPLLEAEKKIQEENYTIMSASNETQLKTILSNIYADF